MTVIEPQPTRYGSMPNSASSAGVEFCPQPAIVEPNPTGVALVEGDPSPQPTIDGARSSRSSSAGGFLVAPPPAIACSDPMSIARVAEYDEINRALDRISYSLNDLEAARKAISNRIDANERGHDDGQQLLWRSRKDDAAQRLVADQRKSDDLLEQIGKMSPGLGSMYRTYYVLLDEEHKVTLDLQKAVKAHPLGAWCASMPGVGPKQFGRLLGAIGNPYWNALEGRPRRGPAELWAYTGYHVLPASQTTADTQPRAAGGQPSATSTDQIESGPHTLGVGGVAPKRTKGVRANWNSEAKMRAFLIAQSCVKQKGNEAAVYRTLYEQARAAEDHKVHNAACAQCGVCDSCGRPPGKNKTDHADETGCVARKVRHAEAGDPLKDSHKNARALRKVAKAVLRDVFLEAKAWHLQP